MRIPLLHIADLTADTIRKADVSRIGLLEIRFTMEQPFYRGRLAERYGIEMLIPDQRPWPKASDSGCGRRPRGANEQPSLTREDLLIYRCILAFSD